MIRCKGCAWLQVRSRARWNASNRHMPQPRSKCYCLHPDASRCSNAILGRGMGFICYTESQYPGTPAIKSAPRWCPRKPQNAILDAECVPVYDLLGHCGK